MAVESAAHQIPASVASALKKAAAVTGVDFRYLVDTAARESGFRASVKAPTSSASGLFQFIESTWLQMVKEHGASYGLKEYANHISKSNKGTYVVADQAKRAEILNLRNNPDIASVMAGVFTQKNAQHMEQVLNRKPTAGELYIAHFLGAGNGGKLVRAASLNPTMKAADLFPAAAKANRSLFYRRGGAVSVKGLYHNLVRRHEMSKAEPVITQIAQNNAGVMSKRHETDKSWPAQLDIEPSLEGGRLANSLFRDLNVFGAEQAGRGVSKGPSEQGQIGVWGDASLVANLENGKAEHNTLIQRNEPNDKGPILDNNRLEKVRGLFEKGGLGFSKDEA